MRAKAVSSFNNFENIILEVHVGNFSHRIYKTVPTYANILRVLDLLYLKMFFLHLIKADGNVGSRYARRVTSPGMGL